MFYSHIFLDGCLLVLPIGRQFFLKVQYLYSLKVMLLILNTSLPSQLDRLQRGMWHKRRYRYVSPTMSIFSVRYRQQKQILRDYTPRHRIPFLGLLGQYVFFKIALVLGGYHQSS